MTSGNGRSSRSLPNLVYTDENEFSVWHNGELQDGDGQGGIVKLDGNVETSGARLAHPAHSCPPLKVSFRGNQLMGHSGNTLPSPALPLGGVAGGPARAP